MIPVIDLFAGPGGLNEGFSSLRTAENQPIFKTIMSVERDSIAHRTLRLRAFFRQIMQGRKTAPTAYVSYMKSPTPENMTKLQQKYSREWAAADYEAVCAELVVNDDALILEGEKRLKEQGVFKGDDWVLIGGPPCQAYSLAGRSRRAHDASLATDEKQTLYRCYLAFIEHLKPSVFVMENVKGMLSAQHDGEGIFGRIKSDMQSLGYDVFSLASADPQEPRDYVVHAERHGIPQARHRVILLGVRRDLAVTPKVLELRDDVALAEALKGIPKVRSSFSKHNKGLDNRDWEAYVKEAARRIEKTEEGQPLSCVLDNVRQMPLPKSCHESKVEKSDNRYNGWYRGRLGRSLVLTSHEARAHLASDLDRYLFCAAYAKVNGRAAKLADFPEALLPNHKNARNAKQEGVTTKFADRFRVQLANRCSTTITSHISKDGHYYIHPDPLQCRSLTVREAARLQTFPDDYFFEGNRTEQYHQVGNAVPPLLAQQIAKVVASCFGIESRCYFDQ